MQANKLQSKLTVKKTPWRHDPRSRNFSHHVLFGTALQSILPETLGRTLRPVEDQKATLRCTGYGTAVNGGYIKGTRFHPDWQAAKIGQLQGSTVDINGGDPNMAMRSERDCGYLPHDATQYSLDNAPMGLTGWQSYDPALDKVAIDNHVAGFVTVDGPYDTFGNIKSALALAYDKATGLGAAVQAFGKWYEDWSFTAGGIIPQTYDATKYGYHHYLFVDFCVIAGVEYLVVHNSGGVLMGKGGFQYMPREVVNREFVPSQMLSPSGTSLKIVKPLTADQIALAKQETTAGWIERMILQAWYTLSEIYISRSQRA